MKIFNTLKKAREGGLEIDKEKLISEICFVHGCARRTAIEYIDTAEVGFNTTYDVNELGADGLEESA